MDREARRLRGAHDSLRLSTELVARHIRRTPRTAVFTGDMTSTHAPEDRLRAALEHPSASARLASALAAGTSPDPRFAPVLVEACGAEPDFFVRDMLTWAITRHTADDTVPLLIAAASSNVQQARSQAFHTLSKVRDPRGWSAITSEVMADRDDEVARAAWRCAVILAPDEERQRVADWLSRELGRGDRELQRSLSRALADLGIDAEAVLAAASASDVEVIRVHAIASQRLIDDPSEGFDAAIAEATLLVARQDRREGPSSSDSSSVIFTAPS